MPRIPVLMSLLLLAGCASAPSDRTELMPAPTVFEAGGIDPFEGLVPEGRQLESEILAYFSDVETTALSAHYLVVPVRVCSGLGTTYRCSSDALIKGFERPAPVDDREDMDVFADDLVDEPVAVNEMLTDILVFSLRHDPPHPRLGQKKVAAFEQSADHPTRLHQRVASDVGGDGINVVERLRRPDYFSSHLPSRILASALSRDRPAAIESRPLRIFSCT